MPLSLNLTVCLMLLCLFSLADAPLRALSLRPSMGSLLCLFTLVLLLIEDFEVTPVLFVSPGGFLLPMAGVVALLANARPGTRRYWAVLALLCGGATYLCLTLFTRYLEASHLATVIAQASLCFVLSNVAERRPKGLLFVAVTSFYLCDMMRYVAQVFSHGSAYLVLGDNVAFCAVILLVVCTVLTGLLRERLSRWLEARGQRRQPSTEAPLPAQP